MPAPTMPPWQKEKLVRQEDVATAGPGSGNNRGLQ